jgi:hypothetical protein
MWIYVVIGLLALVVIVFVTMAVSAEAKNRQKQQLNVLYPFSGYLSPPSPPWTVANSQNNTGVGKEPEDGLYLVGMVGGESNRVPQIKCPVGYKINIVGAYVEVADPFGECGTVPNPTLQLTCGDSSDASSMPSCTTGEDCGAGMTCVAQRCQPISNCTSNSDCVGSYSSTVSACGANFGKTCPTSVTSSSPDGGCGTGLKCVDGVCQADPGAGSCMACLIPSGQSQGVCATMPICQGVDFSSSSTYGLNRVCSTSSSVGDVGKCRPRDASAYLSRHCNGKTECLGSVKDMWKPNMDYDSTGNPNPFGPLPCSIPARSGDSSYAQLPVITGWGGGAPANSQQGYSDPATFNQGYYVHGIYTCIPDDSQ